MNGRLVVCLLSVMGPLAATAQDTPVESPITRVGLFKNGIALVERTVALSGDGTYFLAPGPEPLHGTLWVTGDAEVTVRRSTRMISALRDGSGISLYRSLVGRRVEIVLRERPDSPFAGVIEGVLPAERADARDTPSRSGFAPYYIESSPVVANRHTVVIRSGTGRTYVRPEDLLTVKELEPESLDSYMTEKETPVMEFAAANVPQGGGSVTLRYLTKGLTWAPSYRLVLTETDSFSLAQHALIVNELEDIDAETELITGFPAIMYGNVTSPLAPGVSLQGFFQQVAAQARARMDDPNNAAAITNQAVYYGVGGGFGGGAGGAGAGGLPQPANVPAALMAGDGDLHYLPIGERTLKKDDVLSIDLGEAEGSYRNVLLWTESSDRYNQNHYGNRRNDDDPRLQYPGLWDAVVLANPFDRPLTTAPCYIELENRFLAQTVLYWTASGKDATLPVTKALGIPATVREEQIGVFNEPGPRGALLTLQQIEVTMNLTNPRPEPQEVLIQYRFQARRVHLTSNHEADARILSPAGWNDEYLVTATLTVDPESTGEFQFVYDHHQ